MAWEGRIGSALWSLLGGSLDEGGHPQLGPEDWVLVFVGSYAAAEQAAEALRYARIEGRTGPVPPRYLVLDDPRLAVSVRAPDFESATTVLTALPALGNFALTGPEADQLRESLVLPIDPEDLEGEAERDTAAPPVFRPRWFAWRVLASAALVVALGSAAIGLMGVFTGVAAGFVWLLVAVPFAALFWIAGRRGD